MYVCMYIQVSAVGIVFYINHAVFVLIKKRKAITSGQTINVHLYIYTCMYTMQYCWCCHYVHLYCASNGERTKRIDVSHKLNTFTSPVKLESVCLWTEC